MDILWIFSLKQAFDKGLVNIIPFMWHMWMNEKKWILKKVVDYLKCLKVHGLTCLSCSRDKELLGPGLLFPGSSFQSAILWLLFQYYPVSKQKPCHRSGCLTENCVALGPISWFLCFLWSVRSWDSCGWYILQQEEERRFQSHSFCAGCYWKEA